MSFEEWVPPGTFCFLQGKKQLCGETYSFRTAPSRITQLGFLVTGWWILTRQASLSYLLKEVMKGGFVKVTPKAADAPPLDGLFCPRAHACIRYSVATVPTATKKLPKLPVFLENSSSCPKFFSVRSSAQSDKQWTTSRPSANIYGWGDDDKEHRWVNPGSPEFSPGHDVAFGMRSHGLWQDLRRCSPKFVSGIFVINFKSSFFFFLN